jgi:sulfotransferase
MKKLHFISGLPRSGTTLLSSILNQNPRFSASITGPLARMVRAIVNEAQAQSGYRLQCPEEKRKKLVQSLAQVYYDDSNEVAFDTNRGWTLLTALINDAFPQSKMICCVRDIPWVIDSFEQLLRKNPYSVSTLFSAEEMEKDIYTRAQLILRSDRTVGFALNSLKQALYGGENAMILLVNYEDLCLHPDNVMKDIYAFVGEPYFAHDFDNVEGRYDEFDEDVNLKGLHQVRRKIEHLVRQTILPPDLWHQLEPYSFWKYPEFK